MAAQGGGSPIGGGQFAQMAQADAHFYLGNAFNAMQASKAMDHAKNERRYFAIRGPQMARKGLVRAGFNPILALEGAGIGGSVGSAQGIAARSQSGGSGVSADTQSQRRTAKVAEDVAVAQKALLFEQRETEWWKQQELFADKMLKDESAANLRKLGVILDADVAQSKVDKRIMSTTGAEMQRRVERAGPGAASVGRLLLDMISPMTPRGARR